VRENGLKYVFLLIGWRGGGTRIKLVQLSEYVNDVVMEKTAAVAVW